MGFCLYQYNPSELYRRTAPGTAPETVCGARTFPAADEPEVVVVRTGMSSDGAIYDYVPTGRFIARATDDPYCPAHGGSAAPPPPPVRMEDLELAYTAYQDLAARFAGQQPGALAAHLTPPAQLPPGLAPADASAPALAPPAQEGPVTAADLAAAADSLRALAAQAGGEA